MNRINTTVAAAVALCAANGANAGTLTYDLTGWTPGGYHSLSNSFSLTVDGVEATFAAGSFKSLSHNGNEIQSAVVVNDPHIGRYAEGAGVKNSPSRDQHSVDSNGWKDYISISFATDVVMTGVTFGFYNSQIDDFRWLADSSGDGKIGVGDFISNELTVNGSYSGFGGVQGNMFAFGAFDNRDSWKLKSVTFETISAVPLPAGGVLLISGLFGLAAAKRKKRP